MDYNTLIAPKTTAGSIASWSNYALGPVTDILTHAQALIYQTLRCREMRSPLTPLPVAQGLIDVALPADFLDPIFVCNKYMKKLRFKNESQLFGYRGIQNNTAGSWVTGIPTRYCITGSLISFDVAAQNNLSFFILYFQMPQYLSTDNPTNFLTNRYPLMLLTACLAGMADFRKDDDDYQRQTTRLQTLIANCASNDDLSRRGMDTDADYGYVSGDEGPYL